VVTDAELNLLDEGLDVIIHAADDVLDTMIPFVRDMHESSGLTEAVRASTIGLGEAESLVLDYEQVNTLIVRCHAAGVRVALDDFGTGYSNLGHLHRLEFDTLKLDQGFVRQLEEPRCLAVVRAIVGMARALGCDIVAEGVETESQLAKLTALDCDNAQGYLIGRPQTVDDALRAFAAQRPAGS